MSHVIGGGHNLSPASLAINGRFASQFWRQTTTTFSIFNLSRTIVISLKFSRTILITLKLKFFHEIFMH